MPRFAPLHCSNCDKAIRGILFWCSEVDCKQSVAGGLRYFICEDCFREKDRKCGPHLQKLYKHCILQDIVSPELSSKICRCAAVPRIDAEGKTRSLFPVDPSLRHSEQCGLLSLRERVAEAKHRGTLAKLEKREDSLANKRTMGEQKRAKNIEKQKSKNDIDIDYLLNKRNELVDKMVDIADEDIPFLYRAHLDKYPFGNVHMALTIGPLVIENGVSG